MAIAEQTAGGRAPFDGPHPANPLNLRKWRCWIKERLALAPCRRSGSQTPHGRALLAGGALGLLVLVGPAGYDWARLSLMQHRLDRRLAALAAERQRLLDEQQRLEHEPAYLEGLIRSTFKVAQPNEYVIPLDVPATRDKNR